MDTRKHDILDEAVAAWRASSQEETLSGRARTDLFDEIRSIGEGAEPVFVPAIAKAWRWAFLGSAPVVAIAAVLMVAGSHQPAVAARLSATKVDGQVVFTLANGKANHTICRATNPQDFDCNGGVRMAGNRFVEEATGGPNLVFYRID